MINPYIYIPYRKIRSDWSYIRK